MFLIVVFCSSFVAICLLNHSKSPTSKSSKNSVNEFSPLCQELAGTHGMRRDLKSWEQTEGRTWLLSRDKVEIFGRKTIRRLQFFLTQQESCFYQLGHFLASSKASSRRKVQDENGKLAGVLV
jgi:hypothetical protein